MVKLAVIYRGRPTDPAAFDAYYWSSHLPTVGRWPKVRRIEVAAGQPGEEIYQICDIFFDSMAHLRAALDSPERKVSVEDAKRFPPFEGRVERAVLEVRAFRPWHPASSRSSRTGRAPFADLAP